MNCTRRSLTTLLLLLMTTGTAAGWADPPPPNPSPTASNAICSPCADKSGTDPRVFTTVTEVPGTPGQFNKADRSFTAASIHNAKATVYDVPVGISTEVDTASTIVVCLDTTKMTPASGVEPQVTVDVKVDLMKGGIDTPVQVEGFSFTSTASPPPAKPSVSAATATAGASSAATSPVAASPAATGTPLTYTPKSYTPKSDVPNAYVNLRFVKDLATYDEIVVRVTNTVTQEAVIYHLVPRELGFHFDTTDSVLLVHRQGVTTAELAAGVSKVNFAPAPGATFGGTFLPRKRSVLRFLGLGGGINVSFLDWKDPAFDASTGQFAAGTASSDINIGLGLEGWLFGGAVQVAYGYNLQADRARTYWGIGISFVNVYQKISGLIK